MIMKKEKFLTIYAVLDDESQKELTYLQNEILKIFPNGTQTMGIPFHISLGSFPVEQKDALLEKMNQIQKISEPSAIELIGLDHFNHQVIFVKPRLTKELELLHKAFEGNYSDGFPWEPHITLYCGKEEEGVKILEQFQLSLEKSFIIGLELGEFFPTKILKNCKFK
ncbi:MAG: 2'-5' RNA ligase family protein [Anaeroplasmataceae bacterium]|nr:2'-5' RNA ligase family protein [Anaeroplasmataceae bacterium]